MSWRALRRISRTRRSEACPAGTLLLGTGAVLASGAPPKAANLDRAASAGIDVPAGFVVPESVDVAGAAVVSWAGELGASALAVRSAFGAEDQPGSSRAGWFESEVGVAPGAVPGALRRVRESAARREGTFRLDVLVMAMVDARHAGVAFLEPGTYDDIVNVTDGLADKMLGGAETGDRVLLPRVEAADAGWPRRLQDLLADVRREFGDRPWDVEWADDGSACRLLQIRPVTAPPLRNETMTLANHAEILPSLPSTLMTSVIEGAGPDLFGWYRRRVPGLPSNRDFLHVVAGRPMINLSLLEDMMRHLGLPTSLVAGSIGGDVAAARPLNPARLVRSIPSLARLGRSQVAAVALSARNRRAIVSAGQTGAVSFGEALDDLHDAYVALVTGMFPLSSAIGPPLAMLRALGTLAEHASRHRTITTELADRVRALRNHDASGAGANTVDRAELEMQRFLDDFGHRGVYESDIARPRYRDDPSIFATTRAQARPPAGLPARTARGWLTWPVWFLAARPIAARELLRHDAMRRFAVIRTSLVALAARAAAAGQLRCVDDLWLLTQEEARRLDSGWHPSAAFWSSRETERSRLAAMDVPHVVHRFDDPSDWRDEPLGDATELRGLGLTGATAEGIAWVLDEPADELPDGFDGTQTVLVARSLDAGWVSTMTQVSAVVVEIGGDLSHGSILVRELGLPAVTNVPGATRRITTGDRLRVRGGAGVVELLGRRELVE